MRLAVGGGGNPFERHGADPHAPVGYIGLEREQASVADVPLTVDMRDQQPRVRTSDDTCQAELMCMHQAREQRPVLRLGCVAHADRLGMLGYPNPASSSTR